MVVKLSIHISEEVYKDMHTKILDLLPGSVYGKGQVFVEFAIKHLLSRLNDGDPETVEELKKALAVPVDRKKRS